MTAKRNIILTAAFVDYLMCRSPRFRSQSLLAFFFRSIKKKKKQRANRRTAYRTSDYNILLLLCKDGEFFVVVYLLLLYSNGKEYFRWGLYVYLLSNLREPGCKVSRFLDLSVGCLLLSTLARGIRRRLGVVFVFNLYPFVRAKGCRRDKWKKKEKKKSLTPRLRVSRFRLIHSFVDQKSLLIFAAFLGNCQRISQVFQLNLEQYNASGNQYARV